MNVVYAIATGAIIALAISLLVFMLLGEKATTDGLNCKQTSAAPNTPVICN